MTNSDPPISKRAFDAAVEHAVQYKALFHSMQEKLLEAQDEVARRGRIIERQRGVITDLETRLGVDQDL
jgi:hypothetical protein